MSPAGPAWPPCPIQVLPLGTPAAGTPTQADERGHIQLADHSLLPHHSPAPQIARLRSELDVVRGNTKVMSEMLTEMVPGQEDSSDLELLQVRTFGPGSQEVAQGLGPSLRGTELGKPVIGPMHPGAIRGQSLVLFSFLKTCFPGYKMPVVGYIPIEKERKYKGENDFL